MPAFTAPAAWPCRRQARSGGNPKAENRNPKKPRSLAVTPRSRDLRLAGKKLLSLQSCRSCFLRPSAFGFRISFGFRFSAFGFPPSRRLPCALLLATAISSARMYRRNMVFAAACLGMLLFGIVFLSLGSVNNMLAERFHLDDSSIGTLTALLPFGILAGSLIFGPIVDRFGYKWMLIVCALLVFAGLEGMAFAGSRGFIQFFVFLIGFGGGVLNGATNALAADVSEGERGAKLSLLGVFFGIGALGMPSTLAALSKHFSLAGIVAGIGGFVLVPVLYFLLITFPPPEQKTHPDPKSHAA